MQVKWNRNTIIIPTTAVVGIVTSIIMSITIMDIIITTMSMAA